MHEPLLTLAQAAKLVPTGRSHYTAAALRGWCKRGLWHVRTPSGRYLTSGWALLRFLEGERDAARGAPPEPPDAEVRIARLMAAWR